MIKTFATEGSSRITGMAYDTELKKLKVDFKRGGTYEYLSVPEEIYNQLIASPSIGKAFDELVKGSFEFKKL